MKLVALLTLVFLVPSAFGKGPKILFEEDPTLLTTTISVVFRSGSSEDPKGKTGISNLISDLILRGTKKRNRTQFQSTLERLGGSLGGSASHDSIEFNGGVIRENTVPFLDLLEECLTQPSFSKKEFRLLKQETLVGVRHIKNVNTRLGGLALRRAVFKGTPLERPVRGTVGTLKAIRLKDLIDRYKKSFHKENVLFAVASPIKKSVIEKKLQRIWEKLPDGKLKPATNVKLNIPKKPTLILVNKPQTSTGSVLMGQAGIEVNEPDRYHLYMGNYSFGGGSFVSRLFQVVRGALGWTYAVGSTYQAMGSLSKQKGLFMVYSTPSVEYTTKAIFKIMNMWDTYTKNGLKRDEIELAKDSLVNSYPFNFDSAGKRLNWKVMSELYDVPILSPSAYASKIRGVNNDALVKRLAKHHGSQGWVISVVADAKVIRRQLAAEQKGIPKSKRLKISKILTPNQVIQ